MWVRSESGPKALHFAACPLEIWKKNNKRWEYFLLFILFYFILFYEFCGNYDYDYYDYSLNLSTNQKMESKINGEPAYLTNAKYSIKVYELE